MILVALQEKVGQQILFTPLLLSCFWIRDKHPGSATLVNLVRINTINKTDNNEFHVENVREVNILYQGRTVTPSYRMTDIK